MSNVNEIMMFYKAWQYHKIGINIKKKKAFSHATYTNTFEAWSFFPIYLFSQLFQAFQFFFWDMSNMKTESK